MLLNPYPISAENFIFSKNCFIAEASGLDTFRLGRVYDDAMDEGFSIFNPKTGNHVVFALYNHTEDGDGDLTSWEFRCVTPKFTHLKAVIFND